MSFTTNKKAEWKANWQLVLACFVGFSFFSLIAVSLGIFMQPLGEEFGWSRAVMSGGILVATVVTAVLSPFFGVMIDRFGSRRIALPGLVVSGLAMAGFSLLNGSEMQWLVLWFVYAALAVLIKTTVWTTAVAGVFIHARGLALSLCHSRIGVVVPNISAVLAFSVRCS